MPHLALSPGQPQLAGVPIPTLSPTMNVDTQLLLAEMHKILQYAARQQEASFQLAGKRKREDISTQHSVAPREAVAQILEKQQQKKRLKCTQPATREGETKPARQTGGLAAT